jgi:hypothetical protein
MTTYHRATSTEWLVYPPGRVRIWYTRRETEKTYRKLTRKAGTAGALSFACELIPLRWLERLCRYTVYLKVADLTTNVLQAHARRHCLTYPWWQAPHLPPR